MASDSDVLAGTVSDLSSVQGRCSSALELLCLLWGYVESQSGVGSRVEGLRPLREEGSSVGEVLPGMWVETVEFRELRNSGFPLPRLDEVWLDSGRSR